LSARVADFHSYCQKKEHAWHRESGKNLKNVRQNAQKIRGGGWLENFNQLQMFRNNGKFVKNALIY